MKTSRHAPLLLAALSLLLLSAGPGFAAEPSDGMTVCAEWNFDRAGDLLGWQPNGHLAGVAITNGALVCRGAGADPVLTFQGALEVAATPWQQIEIRMKADKDGTAELFWSNTTTGRFGGFAQEKTTRFEVTGDGQWHTYRVPPYWQSEGKIVRLRLDPYNGAAFAIASIRITSFAAPPAVEPDAFDLTRDRQAWLAVGGLRATPGGDGLAIAATGRQGIVFGPPVLFRAADVNCVSLRLAVDRGSRGTIFFATDNSPGLHAFTFPVVADGRERSYNLDLLAARNWTGRILALGFRPGDADAVQARVKWFRIGDGPQGPPQTTLHAFGSADALPRAGAPARVAALVSNTGGEPLTNLQARLVLPDGVKLLSASPPDGRVARLEFGDEAELGWVVEAERPSAGEAILELAAPGAEPVTTRATLSFTPRLVVDATGYVPEPKPVRGDCEVGAYYFPGWHTAERWAPLRHFPERRPVLGWYREGDPAVADWHIKWAVEHGITFFAYDWYWSQGARHLEHGLHDGYFKARYRHLLKFCLLWANHNPPGTSSHDDCLAVTRYWIENYFRRPEHLLVDAKPVMIIFSVERLHDDLGGDGVKRAFDAMRAECRAAGLKGLHLVGCVGSVEEAKRAAADGYDAVTCYNWPGLGRTDAGMYAPFETLLGGYQSQWEALFKESPIPLSPLPVSGGWDSRPWHGENQLIRFGRTPALFERHLRDAKAFLARQQGEPAAQNPKPIVLIEAWNEWGEGSYIEPHQEFGFGYLDAIRRVFTAAPERHDDVTPADAGLGPYDVPPPAPPATAWDFADGAAGWSRSMHMTGVATRDGALTGQTSGRDPAFFSPAMKARAGDFPAVVVRLRLHADDGAPFHDRAQLFWRNSAAGENEAASAHFDVTGDGAWHDYTVPVASNRLWRGTISGLRLDPCSRPGVTVALDALRLRRRD